MSPRKVRKRLNRSCVMRRFRTLSTVLITLSIKATQPEILTAQLVIQKTYNIHYRNREFE